MTNIIFTESYLSKDAAEEARESFLDSYLDDVLNGELFLTEDEVKYINYHYVVRIMLSSKQMELPLE